MVKRTNVNKWLALALCLVLAAGVFSGCKDAGTASSTGEAKAIALQVVHEDGSVKDFEITTSKGTLREALEDEGLIAGEEGDYGLFVKTVDGETVDGGKQEWWCLTKGGDMWNGGVDSTKVEDGDAFEFTFTVGY